MCWRANTNSCTGQIKLFSVWLYMNYCCFRATKSRRADLSHRFDGFLKTCKLVAGRFAMWWVNFRRLSARLKILYQNSHIKKKQTSAKSVCCALSSVELRWSLTQGDGLQGASWNLSLCIAKHVDTSRGWKHHHKTSCNEQNVQVKTLLTEMQQVPTLFNI